MITSIKYTNAEQTAILINGSVSTGLSAPGAWESIGDGPTREAVLAWIAAGNVPEPYPQPTAAEVAEAKRRQLQADRDAALQATTHDFLDGRIVQVRPQDLANFQLAIANNVAREWVMADNSIAVLAVAEMQAAMQSGITQGEAVWDNYIAELKLL